MRTVYSPASRATVKANGAAHRVGRLQRALHREHQLLQGELGEPLPDLRRVGACEIDDDRPAVPAHGLPQGGAVRPVAAVVRVGSGRGREHLAHGYAREVVRDDGVGAGVMTSAARGPIRRIPGRRSPRSPR
jgi:hypothetical protein